MNSLRSLAGCLSRGVGSTVSQVRSAANHVAERIGLNQSPWMNRVVYGARQLWESSDRANRFPMVGRFASHALEMWRSFDPMYFMSNRKVPRDVNRIEQQDVRKIDSPDEVKLVHETETPDSTIICGERDIETAPIDGASESFSDSTTLVSYSSASSANALWFLEIDCIGIGSYYGENYTIPLIMRDGREVYVEPDTPLFRMREKRGDVIIPAGLAFRININSQTMYKNSDEFSMPLIDFLKSLSDKIPDTVFEEDGVSAVEVDMQEVIGKDCLSTLDELLEVGVISQEDIDHILRFEDHVRKLNADETCKEERWEFPTKFFKEHPDNRIQFLAFGDDGILYPIVVANALDTTQVFLVFKPADRGVKMLTSVTPGRSMPFVPIRGLHSSEDSYESSSRDWFRVALHIEGHLQYRERERVNGVQISIGWDRSYGDFTIYFPGLEIGSKKARRLNVYDQVIRLTTDPRIARDFFELAKRLATQGFDCYAIYADLYQHQRDQDCYGEIPGRGLELNDITSRLEVYSRR